ncbi:MAG TPA: TIGR01777 family oxidoreductase [Bryobacteraceae bacterium]|nr:TIGR01777 family oxidoreductase [Bryobacteraceae bacterium]
MKIALTGASGFIGRNLLPILQAAGNQVRTFGRTSANVPWDALAGPPPADALAGTDAVVHLLGEPVAQRWTAEVKHRIMESRVRGTRNLVQALSAAEQRPRILISASAIGYYGGTGDEPATETSPPGSGFLAETCVRWEEEAAAAEALGLRVVRLRIGIVLGRGGGALAEMLGPFRMGAGGPLGSGQQWMSWIHLQDLIELVAFVMSNTAMAGPVNATSPQPVRNADFAHELASVLHRPALMHIPKFALRLRFGEAADEMLSSSRVVPAVALKAGFRYRFPGLRSALEEAAGVPGARQRS